MAERLQLHAQSGAFFDFGKRHFPGQHGAVKAVAAQVFHALTVVYGHLRAGVQGKLRGQAAHAGGHAQILHDDRVRAGGGNFGDFALQRRRFILAHQRVERHMGAHAAGMTIGDRPFQAVPVKIVRAPAGVEQPRPEVHRVRAVLHGGDERLHAAGRG